MKQRAARPNIHKNIADSPVFGTSSYSSAEEDGADGVVVGDTIGAAGADGGLPLQFRKDR